MSKVLVISPTPSHPQNAGNRARIFNLFSYLQEKGHEIHFVYVKMEGDADDNAMARCWNSFHPVEYSMPKPSLFRLLCKHVSKYYPLNVSIPYKIDEWYISSLENLIMKLHNKVQFDVVIVEYVFLSKILGIFHSDTLKIIDTHDVFTDRHKLFLKNNQTPNWFYTSRKEEKKGLERADVIIAIQDTEKAFFSSLVKKKVITVGHTCKIHPYVEKDIIDSKNLVFIGTWAVANKKSISFFLKKVYPIVKKLSPDIKLNIVGNVLQDYPIDLPEGCNYLGIVDELSSIYENADIVINPILFGTGLKIKMIEALSYSKPVVTTTLGAEGLEDGKDWAFMVADTPEEFAGCIHKIFINPKLMNTLSQNANQFAIRYTQQSIKPLLEII